MHTAVRLVVVAGFFISANGCTTTQSLVRIGPIGSGISGEFRVDAREVLKESEDKTVVMFASAAGGVAHTEHMERMFSIFKNEDSVRSMYSTLNSPGSFNNTEADGVVDTEAQLKEVSELCARMEKKLQDMIDEANDLNTKTTKVSGLTTALLTTIGGTVSGGWGLAEAGSADASSGPGVVGLSTAAVALAGGLVVAILAPGDEAIETATKRHSEIKEKCNELSKFPGDATTWTPQQRREFVMMIGDLKGRCSE